MFDEMDVFAVARHMSLLARVTTQPRDLVEGGVGRQAREVLCAERLISLVASLPRAGSVCGGDRSDEETLGRGVSPLSQHADAWNGSGIF